MKDYLGHITYAAGLVHNDEYYYIDDIQIDVSDELKTELAIKTKLHPDAVVAVIAQSKTRKDAWKNVGTWFQTDICIMLKCENGNSFTVPLKRDETLKIWNLAVELLNHLNHLSCMETDELYSWLDERKKTGKPFMCNYGKLLEEVKAARHV